MSALHGLLAGRCCRLLFEQGVWPAEEVARRMNIALSPANEPGQAAAWVDGLLRGSGLLLLHNEALWQILDTWVAQIASDTFPQLLPLLRRTFSTFSTPERRQMGERAARRGPATATKVSDTGDDVDVERANRVLPLLAQLLGLSAGAGTGSHKDEADNMNRVHHRA